MTPTIGVEVGNYLLLARALVDRLPALSSEPQSHCGVGDSWLALPSAPALGITALRAQCSASHPHDDGNCGQLLTSSAMRPVW